MAPVVQRIADQLGHGLGPGLEFLPVGGVGVGDILLFHTVGADLTPLIMVAAQPYLGDVVKLPVLVDLLGVDMAVVIHDRHLLRIVVVQLFRHVRVQHKILVHKWLHLIVPPCLI